MDSKFGELNTVSADRQLPENQYSQVYAHNGGTKILFIGNSITKHGTAPQIGWHGNWGMAASEESKDYVHLVVEEMNKTGCVDYSIAQCSRWERNYNEGEKVLNEYFQSARDFEADVIVVRIGENMQIDGDEVNCKLNFEKMISFFNKTQKAKVIITNLFWNQTNLNRIIKEIATENNYIFCDISDLERDEKTMALGEYEHEGVSVHPGDYGMKCIAERILYCILQ